MRLSDGVGVGDIPGTAIAALPASLDSLASRSSATWSLAASATFFQRRADRDRAAASCQALVTAPASDIDGKYFDGREPHALPGRVLDPDLRERVL